MLIIGIDPGLSGSICFFEDGKIIDVIEMPTMTEGKKNKKQVNGAQIYNEFSKKTQKTDNHNIKVVIEHVSGPRLMNSMQCRENPEPVDVTDVRSALLAF